MAFQCPLCGAVSHNPNDERERYCARCHVFVDENSAAIHDAATDARQLGTGWLRWHWDATAAKLRAGPP